MDPEAAAIDGAESGGLRVTKLFYSAEEAGAVLGMSGWAFRKYAIRHGCKPQVFHSPRANKGQHRWTAKDIEAVRQERASGRTH